MYIGKHKKSVPFEQENPDPAVNIPENYAGNAFRVSEDLLTEAEEVLSADTEQSEEGPEASPAYARPKEEARLLLPPASPKAKTTGGIQLGKLFSSDTLLVLLAILLANSEQGNELSILLLLLLLF